MSKIVIISRKWFSNRGKKTSLERFCELLDDNFETYHGKMIKLNYRISQFLKNKSNSILTEKGTTYNSSSVKLEIFGLKQSIKNKSNILFYPYADFDYYYTGYVKSLFNQKIVLWTYFSVEELTTRFKNLNHFERADLILVAGKEQFDYLSLKLHKPILKFFPIGVDTDFFKPSISYNKYQIVFSGANRRDFDTAIKAFDIVFKEFKELKVFFIGCYNVKNIIQNRDYIEICKHLTDEEMLKVYQDSHLQVLTLLDGGSSNSLLEGYACGIPVICTNLSNIEDYVVNDEILKVSQNDFIDISDKIIKIFKDENIRNELSKKCLKKAREFDWNTIKHKFLIEINKLK